MKIFVTVGTTRFDSLVRYVLAHSWFRSNDCVLQVGPGGPVSESLCCFDYTDHILDYYSAADVVVSHAGAGAIYELLSLQKRVVIVPNFDRVDDHQLDLAKYMHCNGHAISVYDLEQLIPSIAYASEATFVPFEPEPFSATLDLINYISP